MDTNEINHYATLLHDARLKGEALEQLSYSLKDFSRDDAYSIQEQGIRLREEMGEKVIGLKMGLTSEGKRKQMNLDSPLYGVLTEKMQVVDQGIFKLEGSIHPKIEPEVAFMMKSDLKGRVTLEQVINAVEWVCPAMEILDSRYKGFKYFSMEDVISDNSSSSHYILGKKCVEVSKINVENLWMKMSVNGDLAQEGNSKAISGNPLISLVQLCELLDARGEGIKSGQFVLAGAATPAVALENGMNISLEVEGLGDMSVKVEA